jgi:hypothetical protein
MEPLAQKAAGRERGDSEPVRTAAIKVTVIGLLASLVSRSSVTEEGVRGRRGRIVRL